MFCSQCGNQVSESASFCAKCGAPVRRNTNINVRPQSMQPMQSIVNVQNFENQKYKSTGNVGTCILAIVSLLGLGVSIALYALVWFLLYPAISNVSGWPLIIANLVYSIVLFIMALAVIVRSAKLQHSKIIIVVCVLWLLMRLFSVYGGIIQIIDSVQSWMRAQTSSNYTVNFYPSFEAVVGRQCFTVVLLMMGIVVCILNVYACKKQRWRLANVSLVFWCIYIIYEVVIFASDRRVVLHTWWFRTADYIHLISTTLMHISMYLFWIWTIVKSKQQARKLG